VAAAHGTDSLLAAELNNLAAGVEYHLGSPAARASNQMRTRDVEGDEIPYAKGIS
jgi:hypothetical protein